MRSVYDWITPTSLLRLPYWLAGACALFVFAVLAIVLYLRYRTRRRIAALQEEANQAAVAVSTLQARLEDREQRVAELELRATTLERNLLDVSESRAALSAELAASERARHEQIALVEKSEARLREAFGSLSNEALNRNNQMFLSLAKAQLGEFTRGAQADLEAKRTAVDALVKPIGETLSKMGAALETAEKSRREDHASLVAVHQVLSESTGRLVRALHHSSARGQWGELQLRRVVEMAGMLEHCDFEEQVTVSNAEGKRLRPDLVVRLVGGRTIVVDAKAPMQSYLEACEAESESMEKELRKRHAKAVKAHMSSLGEKNYWSQFKDAPEFVVMFFPNEAVFAEALRIDPGLMEFGVLNQVIPASPATLIALLKAAAYGWQQERAAANARKIFDMGRQLYDRFTSEYKHLAGIGTSLNRAVDNYNKCVASAERMLFPSLRRFNELTEQEVFPPPEAIETKTRNIETEIVSPSTDAPEQPQA